MSLSVDDIILEYNSLCPEAFVNPITITRSFSHFQMEIHSPITNPIIKLGATNRIFQLQMFLALVQNLHVKMDYRLK